MIYIAMQYNHYQGLDEPEYASREKREIDAFIKGAGSYRTLVAFEINEATGEIKRYTAESTQ